MIVSERGSSKTTLLGLLIVGMLAIGTIPSWVIAQNAMSPPAPEPISWLLDPFLRRVPPPTQPLSAQQPIPAAPELNNQQKLVLRLQAMYLVAVSENRKTDAEALAAAIAAMTQIQETGGNSESNSLPGLPGAAPTEKGVMGDSAEEAGNGAPAEPVGQLSAAAVGAPAAIQGLTGGMPASAFDNRIDHMTSDNYLAIGNFETAMFKYPQKVFPDNLALRIKVTGRYDGMVWGTNPYTEDSSLNAAAIHAGLVKAGETAELTFIRRPGRESYSGSELHGVTTLEYGPYPHSFELAPTSQYPDAPYLCDRSALRGNTDAYLSLNMLSGQAPLKPGVSLIVPLHGKAGGPIVGTDEYASDCNLDAAVVHAGFLKLGESGYAKITLAKGLESYSGSKRNGVESFAYGKRELSLRFESAPTINSGFSIVPPASGIGALRGPGELGSTTGADPIGLGGPARLVPPTGQMLGGGGPAEDDLDAIQLDRRDYLGRGLGPRRNWQYERFNLPGAFSLGQLRPYPQLALRIKVTGKNDGPVWGTKVYTDDSSLNAAALHAGLVGHGETADIVVIIRPGQQSYSGSESQGIRTLDFGTYPGSFELAPLSQHPDAPYLCDRHVLSKSTDTFLSLNKLAGQAPLKPGVSLIVPLHAAQGAPIVGTDQYASDCNLDATVVHAGVLKMGESGYVKITIAEGLESYSGTSRNGVLSYPYGKTKMSIRFEQLQSHPINQPPLTSFNAETLRILEMISGETQRTSIQADALPVLELSKDTDDSKVDLELPSLDLPTISPPGSDGTLPPGAPNERGGPVPIGFENGK